MDRQRDDSLDNSVLDADVRLLRGCNLEQRPRGRVSGAGKHGLHGKSPESIDLQHKMTEFHFFIVRGCDSVSEGWFDNKLVDLANSLLHLGLNWSLVPVHVHLQVCTLSHSKSVLLLTFPVVFSNIWPTIRVGAVFAGTHHMIFTSPVFWLGLILIPVASLLLDVLVKT